MIDARSLPVSEEVLIISWSLFALPLLLEDVHGGWNCTASHELNCRIAGTIQEVKPNVDGNNDLEQLEPGLRGDWVFQLLELHGSDSCEPWLQIQQSPEEDSPNAGCSESAFTNQFISVGATVARCYLNKRLLKSKGIETRNVLNECKSHTCCEPTDT